MTRDEILKRFPNASASCIAVNLDCNPAGIRARQPKPDERLSLDIAPEREEASWHDAAGRFEIVFTVYSRRPCDWDGYDIKALQDFLVTAGILPNDGWRTLSGRVHSRKVATEAEEKTVIEITAETSGGPA